MEEEMKALSLAVLACAVFLTVSAIAEAEQCSAQIKALQKQLSAPGGTTSGNAGQSSDAGSSAMGSGNAAGGAQSSGPQSAPPNAAAAQDALDHAKQLDQAGREAECQAEVIKAKAAFGAQ